MEITELTIKLIILLLPGIVGTFIIEKLYYKEKLEIKTFIISTILIGFASYFILFFIKNIKEILCVGIYNYTKPVKIRFFDVLIGKEEKIFLMEILYATIIGLIIGIISAYIINKGIFYKFFREKIHITNSTGQDVWGELFDNNTYGINTNIYVIDIKSNRVYGGWVRNYSKQPNNAELLLTNVIVTEEHNRKKILRRMDMIYLKFNENQMIIEIPKKEVKENNK